MADIFRKSSLDKLSSPEQLGRAITIISPSFWIAAIGDGYVLTGFREPEWSEKLL